MQSLWTQWGLDPPTHDTCKKCAVVQDKIQGKAYRDIKDREGDLNGVGMTHDKMSHGYNMNTMPKQHSDPAKRLQATVEKLAKLNGVHVDTKISIYSMPRESWRISPPTPLQQLHRRCSRLFASYINSVKNVTNKKVILAACMFSTFKKPTGKEWWRVQQQYLHLQQAEETEVHVL